jgi:tryptophan-rich sensory protein
MSKIADAFNSPGWIGLASNLLAVWILLAASIWLLSRTGSDFGAATATSPRDPPWTPPGAFIGAVWALLYTLMALSLWVLNRTPAAGGASLKLGVLLLIVFCLVWPFYAFSQTSRLPGLLGNIGILVIAVFVIWRLWPYSITAAGMIAPVSVWITIATASILDGARRYGW